MTDDESGATPAPSALRMQIAEPRRNPGARTDLKISVPVALRMKLHAHKMLTGTPIADTVEEALEMYFERRRETTATRRAAARST